MEETNKIPVNPTECDLALETLITQLGQDGLTPVEEQLRGNIISMLLKTLVIDKLPEIVADSSSAQEPSSTKGIFKQWMDKIFS
jgi:hypothetical protein